MRDRPFLSLSAVVEAPHPRVATLLTTVRPGPVGPDNAFFLHRTDGATLVLRGGPRTFTAGVAGDPNGLRVEVDPEQGMIAVEGAWWFRGECRVSPHPRGALVEQRAFTVARNRRWLVPVIRLGAGGRQAAAMEDLVQRIGRTLNCCAYRQ